MNFEVNDIITGMEDCDYSVTNQYAKMVVVAVPENGELDVRVISHEADEDKVDDMIYTVDSSRMVMLSKATKALFGAQKAISTPQATAKRAGMRRRLR